MLQKNVLIHETESVKDALKKLDKCGNKVLLVIDKENKLLGTVSDGDIRRYILRDKSLENDIKEVYNKKPVYITRENFSMDQAKKLLVEREIELLPIVDSEKKVVDFIVWSQLFSEKDKIKIVKPKIIGLPAVIMAGGKGSRLEPFNKVFPKPLIPVNDKPIIEIIIDEFRDYGINNFYITLNYKGEMIKSYLNNIEKDYKVEYVWEDDFLGTAGSLKLLEGKINDTFIVSNCDVIVKANYEEVLTFHKEKSSWLTMISSIRHYEIPYGIIKFKDGGEVMDVIEKPEYTFTVNSGVYLLNREALQFIPEKSHFDMTQLIKTLIKNNKKVAMYPVNESDYLDIGQWKDYKKSVEKMQHININL